MGVLQGRYSYYQHSSKFLTLFVTMKKKIKTWLIHRLGGVTESEKRKSNKKIFRLGMNGACIDIRDYADSLYGKPADEWCKLMYEFICGMQERLTHGTDEERPTAHP
nr:MAG TPA_asm: hypothetical protein [Caudoviricetes sp.]